MSSTVSDDEGRAAVAWTKGPYTPFMRPGARDLDPDAELSEVDI
eukprot:COSAG01_NODE_38945_length_483_cov_0.903646_1_plen_43_part_10